MSEEEPKGLGFEGWLNRLSQRFPSDTQSGKFDPGQPLDDLAKMDWFIAIDRRYTATILRAMPGFANVEVLQDLKEIAADYQKLLQAGLPQQYKWYTAEELCTKRADAFSWAAQVCEILHDYPQARQHYTAAAEIYTAVGKYEAAQHCQINLARLELAEDSNIDTEVKRLHEELAKLPSGSVAHARTLIELAGLYSSNGDDYEAEKLLLEAEKILDRIGGDPSGNDLGAALTQSLLSIMQGQHNSGPTPLETKMEMSGLYRELSLALARIYETTHPQEAARYRAKTTQRDSRAYNDEFSEYMRRALDGDLGKL